MTDKGESQLFRKEVLAARQDAWVGDVTMLPSVSMRLITVLVFAGAMMLVGYALWGQYTRKIRVFGYVVPTVGAIKIMPNQTGLLIQLSVIEGQRVSAGDLLAVVSVEKATAHGDTTAEVQKQIDIRAKAIREERERIRELYVAQIAATQLRARNYRDELSQADASQKLQEQRISVMEGILAGQRQLYSGGFVSDMGLRQKEQEHLAERSSLENFKKTRLGLIRELQSAEADIAVLAARSKSEISELTNRLASVEQEKIESESRRELVIRAPQSGVVTALVADLGRLVTPTTTLFTLLPENGVLQAEAYLPSRAVGFVREGTQALVQFQAYPYQKFGSHRARVIRVSRVPVPVTELGLPLPASVSAEPVYIATLKLEKAYVDAYGRQEPLKVGMGFEANLALETRSLLEWFFEPVYSISGNWAV